MRRINTDEYKQILLEILTDFDEFCTQNNITYYAGYGTLLGTIRHKGFIPWDDDVDIIIPRKDYVRILNEFNKRESKYKVKSLENDLFYPYNFAKVYDTTTKLVEGLYHDYFMGAYIDIFPLDAWPKDIGVVKRIKRYQFWIKAKAYKISKIQGLKRNIVIALCKVILLPFSLSGLLHKVEKLTASAESETGYCGNVASNVYGMKEKMKTQWLENEMKVPFENIQIKIPTMCDAILTQLYGDYMTPPPIEKQTTHHINEVYK